MSDIFKRVENKYLLTKDQAVMLQKALNQYDCFIDRYGKTTILSLYYDTIDDLLVLRSLDKPIYKEKLRLRSYGLADKDSSVFLEIKKKYDGIVYKRRIICNESEADDFINNRQDFTSQIGKELNAFRNSYQKLKPKMLLIYERSAFADDNESLRITFDENIRYRDYNLNLSSSAEGKLLLNNEMVLMEIKTNLGYPLWLSHLLSEHKIFKTDFSKYGKAYLDNKFNRKEKNLCQNYLNLSLAAEA